MEALTLMSPHFRRFTAPSPLRSLFRRSISLKAQLSTGSSRKSGAKEFPIAGMEDAFMGFITGRKKATEVAHSVWKNIIQKGDTVIDATCGNGYDTLALLAMVAGESGRGCVYGMDIQQEALDNTSALLEISVEENKRKLVKLLKLCHSKMEDIVQNDNSVRLVVFNLGYLPGGDKAILTTPGTTLAALQAAGRVLGSGGLISVMVYVGHPGGRDELESIEGFASGLPVESWSSFKLEMLNRPTGPVLILIFKK
ncbi:tRNA (mnm(5)s(2)U34)-methyltransferase, chloroplastic [Musa acuminata AAA Group]|uniref:tRNA (mnm(5)s(2)U34)-methyltransferase, chloroplastic n=1 Tax=Musa acuminata AAA Group TaxID=214697 RepID=UPI0031D0FBBD